MACPPCVFRTSPAGPASHRARSTITSAARRRRSSGRRPCGPPRRPPPSTTGPAGESLRDALIAAILSTYGPHREDGFPRHWLSDFRQLVAREPALYGEYLRAAATGEDDLARAIGSRTGTDPDGLRARVIAAAALGAERAAVRHWMTHRQGRLADTVRDALGVALAHADIHS